MSKAVNKEIVVLSEKEHIRARPTVYVGSVKPTDEKIPIVRSGRIFIDPKSISVGLYKLFDEVISNSIDEAKRMKGKMKLITIKVDSKRNAISIRDTGNGFHKGAAKHKISKLSNIETAVSQLRAGSNFNNEDVEESLVGTNGMGVSLVNVLSKMFKIVTVNESHHYEQVWNDYERTDPKVKPNDGSLQKGTEITFEPLSEIFGRTKWDQDILSTDIAFKKRLIKKDPIIKNLDLEFYWDDQKIDLGIDFFPKESFSIETPIGEVIIWEKFEGGGPVSFVNSAMCSGIHQRIVNEHINSKLDDTLGHHFYDTFISLNLPPKLVKFGDQNKTRFVTPREEVEGTISRNIVSKLQAFFKTPLFQSILKKVEERKNDGHIKKLRAEKKKVNVKQSHKYFPASRNNAENLFIVEGLSAMGSILQKRDPQNDGVYALKGKIKNCRTLSDLSENKEILEMMQILNLDPTVKNAQMISNYKRVVIATDPDPDGAHITSLLINLFYKWFPFVIVNGQLNILKTPLVTIGDGKRRKYFFDMEEFKNSKSGNTGIRYLKGLGSLSLEDWEFVMSNKRLLAISAPNKSKEFLDMAFGDSADLRKKWLSGSTVL
jgi:DNA gyrase/topoisomerase IV subunit B